MAITGVGLLAFTAVHLLGNLLVFQGREALNTYAAWLQGSPLLWPARLGLLATFALHVGLAIRLARENRAARPARYARSLATAGPRPASRYVLLTGLTVFAFVVFHLLHFTLGVVDSESHALVDAAGRHDVYGMVVHSFAQTPIVVTYVVAMLLLGAHLRHGALSALHTLGLSNPTWAPVARIGAQGLVAAIVLGNIAIPVLIWLGWSGPNEIAP